MIDRKKARKITENQVRSVANAVCDRYQEFHNQHTKPPDRLLALGPQQLIDIAAHCLRVLVRRHGEDLEIPF